jgi:hypothetical protein
MTENHMPKAPPVIAQDESPTLSKPAKESPAKQLPKWESEARDRLKAAIRRYNKPLSAMLERERMRAIRAYLLLISSATASILTSTPA